MEITTKEFKEKVLDQKGAVIVGFWGSWCLPCQQTKDMLKEMDIGDIPIYTMNVNRNPATASQLSIAGVPTFIVFVDGKEKKRKVGALTKTQLAELLEGTT